MTRRILPLLLTLLCSPALADVASIQYDLRQDVAELVSDGADIKADRQALREAYLSYGDAVEHFGAKSPEAVDAFRRLEGAHRDLHLQLNDFRRDLWALSVDRRRLAIERLDLLADLRRERLQNTGPGAGAAKHALARAARRERKAVRAAIRREIKARRAERRQAR